VEKKIEKQIASDYNYVRNSRAH